MKKLIMYFFLITIVFCVNIQVTNAATTKVVCEIGYTDGALYDNEWLFSITKTTYGGVADRQSGTTWTIFFKNVILKYCPASGCTNIDNSFSSGYVVPGALNESLSSVVDKLLSHPNFKNMYADGNGPSGTLSNNALKQKLVSIERSANPQCPLDYIYIGSNVNEQKLGFIFSTQEDRTSIQTFQSAGYSTHYELAGDDLVEVHKKNFEDHLTKMRENIQEFKDKDWGKKVDETCSNFDKFGAMAINENLTIELYEEYKLKLYGTDYDFTEGDALLAEYKTYKCADKNSDDGVIKPDIDISTPIGGNATENDFLGNLTCGGTQFQFHKSLPNFTATMYDLLKIVTPIIIVVMGMVDMIKAVSAQKEDEIKKAQQKLLRRFIAGVIVFLVFVIVEAVINMFAEGDDANNAMDCVNCFLGGANNCGKFYSSIGQETYEPDDVGCWECTATDNISGYKVYYYGKYKDAFESNSYIYECKKSNRTQNKCTD